MVRVLADPACSLQLQCPCAWRGLVLQAAARDTLANPCPDADAATRQDLTHMEVLAIDDASTREVDDGVSAEVLPDGQVCPDSLQSIKSSVRLSSHPGHGPGLVNIAVIGSARSALLHCYHEKPLVLKLALC